MNKDKPTIIIPERFKNTISLHIIKNILNQKDIRAPLILGINGPTGEGKTFQTELILKEMGITAIKISAKDFENERAGAPGLLLCERYWEASELVEINESSMAVLFINDIDAGIGHWSGEVQYTVNTQIVLATLMNIADYPEFVGDKITKRIPIIVTGNDFTKLYLPLIRECRMTIFNWIPNLEEKINIIRHNIFTAKTISDTDIENIVLAFKDKPIAFFANLKSKLFDDQLLKIIKKKDLSKIISHIKKEMYRELLIPESNFETLLEKAKELDSEKIINHLKN